MLPARRALCKWVSTTVSWFTFRGVARNVNQELLSSKIEVLGGDRLRADGDDAELNAAILLSLAVVGREHDDRLLAADAGRAHLAFIHPITMALGVLQHSPPHGRRTPLR